jgi:hypothetical protein
MSKQPKKPAQTATDPLPDAFSNDRAAAAQPRPVVQAISLIYVTGEGWSALRYTIEGDRVVAVEATEPDIKLVARHKFQVDAGNMLTSEHGGRVVPKENG